MSAGGRLILVDFDDGIDAFECRLPLLQGAMRIHRNVER
jgi:hypothetical protein